MEPLFLEDRECMALLDVHDGHGPRHHADVLHVRGVGQVRDGRIDEPEEGTRRDRYPEGQYDRTREELLVTSSNCGRELI